MATSDGTFTVTVPSSISGTVASSFSYTNLPVSPGQWTAIPNYTPGSPQPNAGTPYVTTSQPPFDGMIVTINDILYRYSQANDKWIKVESIPGADVVEAPKVVVELDGREMLVALKTYYDFLEDLDGLDNRVGEIVDDVLYGLRESIEALERL